MDIAGVAKLIRDIPDFPQPGVMFKDITPVLSDGPAFHALIDALAVQIAATSPDVVVGIEARGFVLAAPVAAKLGLGFVPVRKKGKLPHTTVEASYDLEYGTSTIQMHSDGIRPGARVAIVDDVLATGGTAQATCGLVQGLGGTVCTVTFFIELEFLNGRSKLTDQPVSSLLRL